MKQLSLLSRSLPLGGSLLSLLVACEGVDTPHYLVRSGGETTGDLRSPGLFETAAPNLTEQEKLLHFQGDAAFEALFEGPPATVNLGLGPDFNHRSCASCHVRNGRGPALFEPSADGSPALVRVSLPGADPITGGPLAVPGLGDQLQDHALPGTTPEVRVTLSWKRVDGHFGDGSAYSLRAPVLEVVLANGAPLDQDILTSLRIAPPVFGLGLLEAVPEETLRALEDPEDADGDGVSGRLNRSYDLLEGRRRVGRFGWKANTPDLLHQAAGAYAADMGVTSRLHPGADGSSEVDDETLEATAFYTATLPVPPLAALSEEAARGGELFDTLGCTSCHLPELRTGAHPIAAVSHQRIAPYTDLLVHDLGEELADDRPDFDASGSEWRTTPLWGLGLVENILGHGAYLHDGRARSIEEAILWHGGEAESAREGYRTAVEEERAALLRFLEAL